MIQITQAYRTRYSGTYLTSHDQHEITGDAIVLAAICTARAIGKNQDEVTDIGYQAEDAYQDRFSNKDFNGHDDECRRLRINLWTDAYITALGLKQSEDPTEVADSVLALYDKGIKKDESGSSDDGSAGDGTDSPEPDEDEAYEAGRQEMMDRIDEEEELEEENADYEDEGHGTYRSERDEPKKAIDEDDSEEDDDQDEEDDKEDEETGYFLERQEFEHKAQEVNPDEDAMEKQKIGSRATYWLDKVSEGNPEEAIGKGKQAYLAALRRGDSPETAGDAAIARWHKAEQEKEDETPEQREERLDYENREQGGITLGSGARLTAKDRLEIAKERFLTATKYIAIAQWKDEQEAYMEAQDSHDARFDPATYISDTGAARIAQWHTTYLRAKTQNNDDPAGTADKVTEALYGIQ